MREFSRNCRYFQGSFSGITGTSKGVFQELQGLARNFKELQRLVREFFRNRRDL